MSQTNFMVIGSNSFSGSSFIRYLIQRGQNVIGVSRSDEINSVFLPYKWDINSNCGDFTFIRADLNHDLNKVVEICNEFKPQFVVNFAAQGMVAQSWLTPEDWYQTNVVAQVKFHNELRKMSFVQKYVHVTTPEVYGSTEGWINENFNFSPSTPYAVSRAACDLHLMSFFNAYKFPVVFTRAANVYGPGQQLYRIIPRALLSARLGKKLPLNGGGKSIRSFIHINDVASATYLLALNGTPGESYHISTNHILSIRELVEEIAKLIEVPFEELVNIDEERLGKDQAYLLNSQKIRSKFGWEDKIGLPEGIRDTLQWIDSNLDILKNLPMDYIHKK